MSWRCILCTSIQNSLLCKDRIRAVDYKVEWNPRDTKPRVRSQNASQSFYCLSWVTHHISYFSSVKGTVTSVRAQAVLWELKNDYLWLFNSNLLFVKQKRNSQDPCFEVKSALNHTKKKYLVSKSIPRGIALAKLVSAYSEGRVRGEERGERMYGGLQVTHLTKVFLQRLDMGFLYWWTSGNNVKNKEK